ncbi:MAG: cytochrome c biogenesis protein ResB [Planctomycetes bacterium]|nr:cytochrome c biogenesis protein ResB [Planctomycetota bacterium]
MSETRNAPRLRGGFIAPEPRHMPTLFSLIITWAVLACMATIIIPYLVNRNTDSMWTQGETMTLAGLWAVVSTIHGALGYVMGYRRGGSVWNFIIPALLLPVGLLIVHLSTKDNEERWPDQPSGLVKRLDRILYATGNIWWGIGQLSLILVVLATGTIYETKVGPVRGNEAAYAAVYNAWWMGLLFVVFFITLYCATMRKYPFRISQIGWLMTHAGLLILIVGCMIMYWGSYSGFMSILEGHRSATAYSRDDRELRVEIPRLGFNEVFLIDCDKDPEEEDVAQTIEFTAGEGDRAERFEIEFDRFFGKGRFVQRIKELEPDRNGNLAFQAGVEFQLDAPGTKQGVALVDMQGYATHQLGPLNMRVITMPSETYAQGLGHRYGVGERQRGRLALRFAGGAPQNGMDIVPLDRDENPSSGAPVQSAERRIDAQNLTVRVERYYDDVGSSGTQAWMDLSPGTARNPAIDVLITGDRGMERRLLLGDGRSKTYVMPDGESYPLALEYGVRPELEVQKGEVVFAIGPDGIAKIALGSSSDGLRVEDLVVGRSYRMSEGAPVRITAKRFSAHADFDIGWVNDEETNPARVLRTTVRKGSDEETLWIPLLNRVTRARLGNVDVLMTYWSRPRQFPFEIAVLDFRQTNYPNSTVPSAFETNVILRDPELGLEQATLIDMNHPLEHRGFRFFNSNPIDAADRNERGIRLSVSRNPGLWPILFGSLITTIGIVVVFFFKPKLRRWETLRRSSQAKAHMPSAAPVATQGV